MLNLVLLFVSTVRDILLRREHRASLPFKCCWDRRIRILAEHMTSSPHHWFVQTDFGALLGPMPDDALAEMARTGALLARDRVREGTDGEWRPASEVPGLFDEQIPSLGLLSSTLEDLFAPESSAPRESDASRNANRRSVAKSQENPTAEESRELEFEIDAPLIAPQTVTKPPPVTRELEFEIDVPLIDPTPLAAVSSVVESPSVPETLSSPIPTLSTQPGLKTINDLVPSPEPPNIREPEPILSAPSGWQPRVTPTPRWQPTATRSLRGWQPDKQTWLVGAIAAVMLVVLIGAWWLWPRQRPDLYKNYVAIYQELQQRRDLAEDHAKWMEFVARSKTQLAETVPWLESNAKPGDREKSLLLYAGRDLQELLELPRTSKSPHQKRLDAFFEQLQEIYGSK